MRIPDDPLGEIYNINVIGRFQKNEKKSLHASNMLRILRASGPDNESQFYRCVKTAWEAYLSAAFSSDFFCGKEGKNLRTKLTDIKEEGFRSAMSECLACWFFAGKLKLHVDPYPTEGRNETPLDMAIILPDGKKAFIEVKAPQRELPKEGARWGDDIELLRRKLKKADCQFSQSTINILFIAPKLHPPIYYSDFHRHQLIRAFFGEEMIVIPFNSKTGNQIGPPMPDFFPDGHP